MKTPWHLWTIGILSLVWNFGGAFDYTMTQTRADWYMSAFSPEQLAYFYGFPAWAVAGWATGVWFALLGSVLLLLRRRWAGTAFGLSILGLIVTSVYTFGVSDAAMVDLSGPGQLAFTAAIYVVTFGLWLYARAMSARGVLR